MSETAPASALQLRAPATPLITHTPYFSIWSVADTWTGSTTRHWTGRNHPLTGYLRVDGVTKRFLGEDWSMHQPEAQQVSSEIHPTRSIARFQSGGVELEVEFLSPLLTEDLDILTRPVTYVTFTAKSIDGASHLVEVSFDVSAEIAVNNYGQDVFAARLGTGSLETLFVRSVEQRPLHTSGDDIRIDWGTLLLSVPTGEGVFSAVHGQKALHRQFIENGSLPATDDTEYPRSAGREWPSLAVAFDLGKVGEAPVSRYAMVAYDEEYALEYFGRRLVPYWKRNGDQVGNLLTNASAEYESIREKAIAFDANLEAELNIAGGPGFAWLCSLAYRQTIAAHGIAQDLDGTLLMMSKENFSNGCICTVDVTYPGSPVYFHLAPDLMKAQIEPILQYASTPRWKFPFAPHDLGTYPLANGQVYGGGEKNVDDQMPVEECGNMLVLTAAYTLRTGDKSLIEKYRGVLDTWAKYLLEAGLDPENQLCTDDFAGHLAHNANLSIKAIVGIAAYAKICPDAAEADKLSIAAKEMASKWHELAVDGDHTKLAFDRPGTWSQKYNLVWDRLLKLNLFPDELLRSEIAYYLTKQDRYGLPLDNRSQYTKLDWVIWTATLAETEKDFRAIVDPAVKWASETPTRVPLSDWYWTHDGKQVGFQARSVVGGLFLPLLKPIDG